MSKPLPAQANSHAPRRPFFSRLQFKHYVWIAAAILLLSGLRILFIRGGASASPPASVGVEQPAASAPAASEPVASAPAAPPDQSASPAAPQPDARPSNNAATEDNSNSVNSNASPQRPTRAARVETRRREKKAGGIGGFIKKLNPLKLNPFKGKKKQ